MLFNSIPFLIFFVIVTTLFFLVPSKAKNYILLAASYVFYMWWDSKLIALIVFTTLVSFISCLLMELRPQKKKLTLVLSIISILSILVFFKYYNFVADGIASLINFANGTSYNFHINILLPIGISFYTFQTISYVVDVYRGKIESEKNIFTYALYISFFPQLVAGPIERSSDLLPQLKAEHHFDPDNFVAGIKMMIIGFFEKIAVADMIGLLVNEAFENVSETNGLEILIATILFCIQILCDFKGYSDIAKGIARIYGIRLSENFNHPYSATSIKEFWNRWHLTLSTWFRDYVYFPLGGSRVSTIRWMINILIVFLLSGLWHGADITFVLWGLILAAYRILERFILRNNYEKKSSLSRFFGRIITFILIALAWIMFRSNNIKDALNSYSTLFTKWSFSKEYFSSVWNFFDLSVYKALLLAFIIALFLSFEKILSFSEKQYDVKSKNIAAKIVKVALFSTLIWLSCGSFIYLNSMSIESSFIYFQF